MLVMEFQCAPAVQIARARDVDAGRRDHLGGGGQVQRGHGLFASRRRARSPPRLRARRAVPASAPPATPARLGSARECRCCSPRGRGRSRRARSRFRSPARAPSSASTRDVAGLAVAEAEIVAHQHGARAQPLHQQLPHELLRREPRHLAGERQNQHLLDAFLAPSARRAARARSSAAACAPAPPRAWDADRR